MSGDFLDSNVIVYLFSSDLRKRVIAEQVVNAALVENATISFQVVQEVLNVASKTLPALPDERIAFLLDEVLTPLWKVSPSRSLYDAALQIRARYGYTFYDSVVIAAALEADSSHLLSENMQHGQRIDGLLIENPFRV